MSCSQRVPPGPPAAGGRRWVWGGWGGGGGGGGQPGPGLWPGSALGSARVQYEL